MTRPIVLQGDRKSVTRTGIGTFLSVILGAVAAFAATLLVSNNLGEKGAGVFFQILAFFAITSTACIFGADTALVRSLTAQLTLGHRNSVWKTFVVAILPVASVSLIVAAIFWFNAPHLARVFNNEDQARQLIRLLSVFIPPGSLLTTLFGGLRGFGRVRTFTVLQNVLLPWLRFGAVAAVVLLGIGTLGLAIAWVAPVLFVLAAAALLVRRSYLTYRRSPETAQLPASADSLSSPLSAAARTKSFWSFAAGRGASSLVEIVLEWIDVIFVGIFLGPAAAGVYGVVNRCVRLGQMADHSARIVVGPMLGAAMATSDRFRTQKIYITSTRVLVLVAWPFYFLLLIGGSTLLSFFGPEFRAGYPALVIVSVAMALAVTAGGVQSVLLMAGRSRWQMYNKLAALSVAITGNILLIPWLGLRGAAIAWAAAVLLDCTLATWQVHHFLKIRMTPRAILLPAVLAFSIYGLGFGLARLILGPSLLIFVVSLMVLTAAYGVLLWKYRVNLGLATLRGG